MKTLWSLLLISLPLASWAQNPDLPDASVLTDEYLKRTTAREIGQKDFTVKIARYPQQQQEQQSDGQSRDVQESDVFKIGNPQKKELFLLNDYRGFQVISFADGLKNPKLLSRLPIRNNWSSEMYYLAAQETVIILNTESKPGTSYSDYHTKIYSIDVSNSEAPKIITEHSVTGYLEETRMVGDVLYVVTQNMSSEREAKITSVKLSPQSLETIDEVSLAANKRSVRHLNVVKHENKFYALSSFSNWNEQGDIVTIHDITSPNGKISHVLSAQVRGSISERSQIFLHRNHLFAVSNYREDTQPLRVSVEGFPLSRSTTLQTSMPKLRVSVGDTNGLNASLQDVRVAGDHLYAFWVPSNNIDPFELFDLSDPAKGIKHLGQLQFEGWISKAFPLTHHGKNYVLGLGWVIPSTSENNRQKPQAKLFEIKNEAGKVFHEEVSSLSITGGDIWSSFNNLDKYFEVINDGDGRFNILFPVTYWRNWKGGAKIVTADLNTKSLKEGASIVGSRGWLKRVFTNKEINALHTFSNERLDNFDHSRLSENGVANIVSTLELARRIVAFHPLENGSGLQFVAMEDEIEVRKVENVDAEKTDSVLVNKIPGEYSWHKISKGKLYTISKFYQARGENEYYWSRKFLHANFNVYDLQSGELVTSKIDLTVPESGYFYFNVMNVASEQQELFTIGDSFFRLDGNQLLKFEVSQDCRYFFDNKEGNLSIGAFGKDVIAFNSFLVKEEERNESDASYFMPFFKVLEFDGNQVSCSRSINVPGQPVFAKDNYIVTSQDYDDWYEYGCEQKQISEAKSPTSTMPRTFSLSLEESHAVVVDMMKDDISDAIFNDGFISLNDDVLNLWSLTADGEFVSKPFMLQTESYNSMTLKTFKERSFVFVSSNRQMMALEVTGGKKVKRIPLTSSYDRHREDGVAENIYSIVDISASTDNKSFYLSQGLYGATELTVK